MDYNELRQKFTVAMNRVSAPFAEQPMVLACALAFVLSRELPLPGDTPQADPKVYALGEHDQEINRVISLVNEITFLNTRHAKNLTLALYCMRFSALHPVAVTKENLEHGFVDAYFGAGQYLSMDDSCMLNKYKQAIIELAPHIKLIMEH